MCERRVGERGAESQEEKAEEIGREEKRKEKGESEKKRDVKMIYISITSGTTSFDTVLMYVEWIL